MSLVNGSRNVSARRPSRPTHLLRSDGSAVAVADNDYGQTTIPALPTGVTYTQVAAGPYHTVLLSGAVSGRPTAIDDA